MGHPASRQPASRLRHQARRPGPARAARGFRLGGAHADRDQDRRLGRQGRLDADIARAMFLSRRTVQTYISHILAKLGAKGRVEIVREALRHGVSP